PRRSASWRAGHPARGCRRRGRPAPRMVTRDGRTLVIAVLGLGEAGSVIARDLTAAGTRVRGYDPAVPAAGPVLDTASEAEAAQGSQLVLSVNTARAAGDEPWLREHIAAELTAAEAAIVDRITDGTRRHAVRRAAEMAAAADMLTELGIPPLMADASRALHERLAD